MKPPGGGSSLPDDGPFLVVVNHEDQYSIWPAGPEIPAGWTPVGRTGTEQECLGYIETVWTDMRPRSLRQHISHIEPDPTEVAANGPESRPQFRGRVRGSR
ncbi:MbtH family protein [Amycolatopsis tolypomycina]|uniref:MbtH family protein n=1 Tax=Amycolatopsis tolypomycina TaxID=208445 RepID=UPI003134435F